MSEKPTKALDESRRKFLQTAGLVPAALYLDGCASAGGQKSSTGPIACSQNSMMDFVAAPLDTVRIGLIGMGRRGLPMLRLFLAIDGV